MSGHHQAVPMPLVDTAPADASKKTNKKRLLLSLIKLLVSGALLYWIFRDVALREIFAAMQSANWFLLGIAALLHLVGYVISAYRWRLLLKSQGTDASILFLVESYLVSGFFNNFLPSTIGGDTMRAYDTWRVSSSKSKAVAVIFVDRFLGVLVLMLFALVALLFANELTADIPLLGLWTVLGFGGMLLLTWLIFAPPRQLTMRFSQAQWPFAHRVQRFFGSFLVFQEQKQLLYQTLALSLLLQANVVFHYYLVAVAMDLPIPLVDFFLIIPLISVLMMIPISINAIGIRENAFILFFAPFAVSGAEAIAYAWIIYALLLLYGVIGGVLYAMRR
jgi:glycosyltransferase 2 family protein